MGIYVWGTGNIAKRVVFSGMNCEITGFIESDKKKKFFFEKRVYNIAEIKSYSMIIVANTFSNEIYKYAKEKKIDVSKMIFMCPCEYVNPRENIEFIRDILGEKNFEFYVAQHKIYELSFFERDRKKYNELNTRENFKIEESNMYPILSDKYEQAGSINDYFWQDLWAAKHIYKDAPKKHYDIGSRVDGFIAHILAMDIPISVIDIRPAPQEIDGMQTIVDDATELRQFEDGSIDSLSALCSLEHFGLGRYGDTIDPEACFKCFEKIQNKMKEKGKLYISVPIGKEKVCFNAHRVFYPETIVKCFNRMKLVEFSCTHNGNYEENIPLHKYDNYDNGSDAIYGLFYFVKEIER